MTEEQQKELFNKIISKLDKGLSDLYPEGPSGVSLDPNWELVSLNLGVLQVNIVLDGSNSPKIQMKERGTDHWIGIRYENLDAFLENPRMVILFGGLGNKTCFDLAMSDRNRNKPEHFIDALDRFVVKFDPDMIEPARYIILNHLNYWKTIAHVEEARMSSYGELIIHSMEPNTGLFQEKLEVTFQGVATTVRLG